ncbi:MAG: anaerobic ribonucleoside-triphosphate reductase activating protein, partial [Otoolea sp.]
FVSGCTHHCEGCFNAQAWDFHYGEPFTEQTQEQILGYLNHDYVTGLTLLGGEPMEPQNQEAVLSLVRKVRERLPEKTIWCYTGYDFEKDILGRMMKTSEVTRMLVPLFDVMVDGRFVQAKRNLRLKFRGSENQRILDVAKSLEAEHAVWCEGFL